MHLLNDILTVVQVAVVSYHSTGVRMQQAMVLITVALVIAVYAKGVPEGLCGEL